MALWLLVTAGAAHPSTRQFLAYALVSLVLIVWAQRRPTALRWRLRLIWYPCVMGLSFYSLPAAVAALGRGNADALLDRADRSLLGGPAAEALTWLAQPAATDALTLAYLFFFVVLIFGPGYYCLRDLARFRVCIVGLFVLYALGFCGYVALPAAGPWQFLDASLLPLPRGPFSSLMHPVIGGASNGVDVFPSIHFAASLYLLVFDWWHHRRRFWLWLVPIVLLWLSTVALRYHYLVDLFAGVVIALLGLASARAYAGSARAQSDQAPFIAASSPPD